MPTFLEPGRSHGKSKTNGVASLQQETCNESEASNGAQSHLEERAIAENYEGASHFTFVYIEIIVFYCLTISEILDYEVN